MIEESEEPVKKDGKQECMYIRHDKSKCEEESLTESKDNFCIFHEKVENKDNEMCMKRFYENVNNGKINFEGYQLKEIDLNKRKLNKTINFRNATFVGGANFNTTTFQRGVYFDFASFHAGVSFANAIFFKRVSFHFTNFKMGCSFISANFNDVVYFTMSNFGELTDFAGASFGGDAHFGGSNFRKRAVFKNSKFNRTVSFISVRFFYFTEFDSAQFKNQANFTNAQFNAKVNFTEATLKMAIFSDTIFERGGSFKNCIIDYATFEGAELGRVLFEGVDLSNHVLNGAQIEDAYLSGAIWKDKKSIIREEREIESSKICSICGTVVIYSVIECEGCNRNLKENIKEWKIENSSKYKRAEGVYRNIKLSLQNEGDYEKAGKYYQKEMILKRKAALKDRKISYWLASHFYSKICGYGERISFVLLWTLTTILGFGTLYWVSNGILGEKINGWWDYYYFSVVTFTTLGFGDIHPDPNMPWIRIAAMTEAFIGAFMIALFVVTVSRKMMR